jgi:hypothetical protein
VIVAGDNDSHGAGQRTAAVAAVRFQAEGRKVMVSIPPEPDTDWNDILTGELNNE